MRGTLMKTNVTVSAASMTLTHWSEKVNTAFQSVSESQIQFDSTHTVAGWSATTTYQLDSL